MNPDQLAHAKTLGWLARAGLVARGVVYGIIGILALKLALGDGGKATDQEGALQTIARQSFGKALLLLVAIGLGGYALWRLVRAAVGHGAEQTDSGFDRISALDSGIAYGLLCIAAIGILTSSGGGGGSTKETTGGILDWALESRVKGQKRLETPDLDVSYEPPKNSGFLRGDWRNPA